jgi:Bacterial SH3 domain
MTVRLQVRWTIGNRGLKFAGKAFLLSAFVLLTLCTGEARKRTRWGEGLSVDVDTPYEKLAKIVQQVSEDGIIRGTSEYRGAAEIAGASASKTASGFEVWKGTGTVLYKIRSNTVAPDHFYGSTDQGTLAVRYILQPVSATLSHLKIDAIFEEDAHHELHPSDGQVENSEYGEISRQLEQLDDQEHTRMRESAAKQEQAKLESLRLQLDRENAELSAAFDKEHQLEKQAQELQVGSARIRTARADLKAEPHNEAEILLSLPQGATIRIQFQVRSWCQVRTEDGKQGWVYCPMLEIVH